jgi:hypothetical protein
MDVHVIGDLRRRWEQWATVYGKMRRDDTTSPLGGDRPPSTRPASLSEQPRRQSVHHRFVVDRRNQETAAIAIDFNDAVESMPRRDGSRSSAAPRSDTFDRHGGVGETSRALYLFPSLVQLDKARPAPLTMPPHLTKMHR